MLLPLGLSARQFVIGAVVLVTYFPCAATFAILSKELGIKGMAAAAVIMLFTSLFAGTLLNLFLETVSVSYTHLDVYKRQQPQPRRRLRAAARHSRCDPQWEVNCL